MISSIFALKGRITRSIFAYLWTPSIWKASIWEALRMCRCETSRNFTCSGRWRDDLTFTLIVKESHVFGKIEAAVDIWYFRRVCVRHIFFLSCTSSCWKAVVSLFPIPDVFEWQSTNETWRFRNDILWLRVTLIPRVSSVNDVRLIPCFIVVE